MQRHAGTDSGLAMHLARIAELLLQRGGRRRLQKFAKARARVGESPGGQLDLKVIEGADDVFRSVWK